VCIDFVYVVTTRSDAVDARRSRVKAPWPPIPVIRVCQSIFPVGLVFAIQHALTSSPLSLRTIRFARFLSARTTR